MAQFVSYHPSVISRLKSRRSYLHVSLQLYASPYYDDTICHDFMSMGKDKQPSADLHMTTTTMTLPSLAF